MIPANVKKTSTDAIQSELKSGKKWKEAGAVIAVEYKNAEAFTTIKNEYLDEVVYPAMGDEALRIMRAEVPRKGSKEWNSATSTQQAEWAALNTAKIGVRGAANSLFSRVRDKYAFPKVAENKGPDEKRTDDVTYCVERNTQCAKRLQKSENPPKNTGKILALYAEIDRLLTA